MFNQRGKVEYTISHKEWEEVLNRFNGKNEEIQKLKSTVKYLEMELSSLASDYRDLLKSQGTQKLEEEKEKLEKENKKLRMNEITYLKTIDKLLKVYEQDIGYKKVNLNELV